MSKAWRLALPLIAATLAALGAGPSPALGDVEAAAQLPPPPETCESCHYDLSRLRATARSPEEAQAVWVDLTLYPTARHPFQCSVCHKGQPLAANKDQAHQGLIAEPDAIAVLPQTCGQEKCHPSIVETYPTSLHATLAGIEQGAHEVFDEEYASWLFDQRCFTCHATCSDCHLTEPDKSKRVASHAFLVAPASETCLVCHDQTGQGYLGYAGYFEPSVHAKAGLLCSDCHTSTEMHGTGESYTRLKDALEARCEDCHQNPGTTVRGTEVPQFETGAENVAHALHEHTLDCSACHVAWNYNCYGCHGYDENGDPKGYDRYDTQVYLARDPETGKVATVVHPPMSQQVGGREFANGAWTFKNRHSIQLRPRDCVDCHSSQQIFVGGRFRTAPFVVGSNPGEFLPQDRVAALMVSKPAAAELASLLLPEPAPQTGEPASPPPPPPGLDKPVEEHVAVRIARGIYQVVLIPAVIGVLVFWIALDVVRRRRTSKRGEKAS